MTNIKNIHSYFILCALFMSSFFNLSAQTHEIIVNRTKDPLYPQALAVEGILEGSVTYLLLVNTEGELLDSFPTRATKKDFINAIDNVINDWTFEPAQTDGVKITSVSEMTFNFKYSNNLLTVDFTNAMERVVGDYIEKENEYGVVHQSRLDAAPKPIKTPSPRITKECMQAHMDNPIVRFKFYIDTEGKVRIPVIINQNTIKEADIELYKALSQWEFEPAIYKGKPSVILAEQSFALKL